MADLTTGRGYPYPESTDNINPPADVQALAQAVDDDLVALIDPDVETTTSNVGTVAANFTVNDVRAATVLGGKVVDLDLYLGNANSITSTAGNLPDTLCFTLASAYWPSHSKSCSWGNGTVAGEAIINSDGTIYLRSANGSPAAGGNIRLSGFYIKS